jgi:hypothetical protein
MTLAAPLLVLYVYHCRPLYVLKTIAVCRGWDYKDTLLPGKPHIEYDVSDCKVAAAASQHRPEA